MRASAAMTALLIVFLWTPLTNPASYFLAVDLLQASPLLRIAPPEYVPRNPLQVDTIYQMLPFQLWNRDQVSSGSLPLWNPYNGAGVPHLANLQSAPFSPFNLPFYVLEPRLAILVSDFLKLFCIGVFTSLFLRRLGISQISSLLGGTAFAFSGYAVLWLNWQHPATLVALPAGLYTVESYLACNRITEARRRLWLVAVALAVALGLIAGHAETYFFIGLLMAAYVLVRTAVGRGSQSWQSSAWSVIALGSAGIVGAALSAVQVLPFLEYLQHSVTGLARAADPPAYALFLQLVPLQLFPNLLGSPTLGYYDPILSRGVNYNEANSTYLGLCALFLAGLGLLSLRWRPIPAFCVFAAGAGVWFLYAYNIGGVEDVLNRLVPFLRLSGVFRTHVVWLFCLASLAALGLDVLRAAGPWKDAQPTIMKHVAVWGTLTIVGAASAAAAFLFWASRQRDNAVSESALREVVGPHVIFIMTSTALAIVLSVLLARRSRFDQWLAGVLVLVVFAQSGLLLRDNTPTVDARYFYPMAPALAAVAERVGNGQTLFLADAALPANANLVYRLRSPASYDAIAVYSYANLYSGLLHGSLERSEAHPQTVRELQAMGIQYVVSAEPTPLDGLEQTWTNGNVRLFRVPDSLPRYFSPGHSRTVATDQEALRLLRDPDFDLRDAAVLIGAGGDSPMQGPGVGTVEVLDEQPTRIHLSVQRDTPGWLVALQTHYPGWTATVNGQTRGIVATNLAYTGVALDAGKSDVRLTYDPPSFRIGLAITTAAAMVLVAITGVCVWQLARSA